MNQSKSKWEDNFVQFPRLISEIVATQELDLKALADSMDLTIEDVNELLDRAQQSWEDIKRRTA
jgi:hypothetical protein